MKKIKITVGLLTVLLLSGCGYKLPNEKVDTSTNRQYPKRIDYEAKVKNQQNESIQKTKTVEEIKE